MNLLIQDPVLIFAAMMLILLVAPLLFARFRVPGLIGLIISGMLVGPHALGFFAEDTTFDLLGKVGVLYLMFLAGLETEFNEFLHHRRGSLFFGATTFLIPQVVGAVVARLAFGFSWPTSILLASMFASNTLIPLPIVTRLGLTRHRAVTTAIGGTILTNIAALLVLAAIVQQTAAELTGWFWVRQIALMALLLWVSLWLLPRVGYWFFRVAAPDETAEFLFILAAAFAVSYLSLWCRVEPILGAFLAGLSLNRLVPANSPLMHRLEFVGNALFIPFFLIAVGMKVNLAALLDLGSWSIALYMTGMVILTKWLAAEFGGRLLRYNSDERALLFGLSVNQAAATLAAVLVGVRIGLFDHEILNGSILMILGTCIAGPWVTQIYGERLARQSPARPATRRESSRVMVAVAHPESAPSLVDLALVLRGNSSEPLFPLAVVQDGVNVEERVEAAEHTLERSMARAAAAGVPVVPVTHIETTIAGGIVRAIREYRAGIVVMGWSRRFTSPHSFLHWLPRDVLDRSAALLALARIRRPIGSLRRILCVVPPGVETAPGLEQAIQAAQKIAALSELHLFASAEAMDRLRSLFARWRAASPLVPHPLTDADAVVGTLSAARPSAQDAILVLAARPGGLGWRPRWDRLPETLLDAYPDADLVVLYPPPPEDPTLSGDAADVSGAELLPPEAIRAAENGAGLGDTLAEPMAAAYHDRERGELFARRIAAMEMTLLAPGIAITHIHEHGVGGPRAFLALSRTGFTGHGVPMPLRAVFALVSDLDQPSERHLRALARIARAVQSPKFRELLEAMAPAGQIADTFAEAAYGLSERA